MNHPEINTNNWKSVEGLSRMGRNEDTGNDTGQTSELYLGFTLRKTYFAMNGVCKWCKISRLTDTSFKRTIRGRVALD